MGCRAKAEVVKAGREVFLKLDTVSDAFPLRVLRKILDLTVILQVIKIDLDRVTFLLEPLGNARVHDRLAHLRNHDVSCHLSSRTFTMKT